MTKRVLISGASIAGNSAAWWLGRYGFDVTVVEKFPQFRDGGQNVDVRGVGRKVLQRMALEDEAFRNNTGEEGTAWIGPKGEIVASILTKEIGTDGPTAELEILRGDLAKLVYEGAKPVAKFIFGDTISEIHNSESEVRVLFTSGTSASFDLVVIAEGVGSPTRELVFPGQNKARSMDLTMAFFTIEREPSDNRLWNWYHTTGGRSISLRPDRHGTTRVLLSVQKRPEGEEKWPAEKQKAWLSREFRDAGWQAERVRRQMATTKDFYFDNLRQVQLPSWRKGRVVLTGDAAWCVTPIGGIGSTLALTGGLVLAGSLKNNSSLEAALCHYEAAMRPMVNEGQSIPKFVPRLMNPQSRAGLRGLHLALKLGSRAAKLGLFRKLFGGKRKEPDISIYPDP